jgi:hypothetical protein
MNESDREKQIISEWNLTEDILSTLLSDFENVPGPGSPLKGINLSNPQKKMPDIQNKSEISKALSCIHHPEIILGKIGYSPPDESEFQWFYGLANDPQRYALYKSINDSKHYISWPIEGISLLQSLQSEMSAGRVIDMLDISVFFDRMRFETLTAVVDLLQEVNLYSLLNRIVQPEMQFSPNELLESCRRTLHSPDLRWMVSKAQMFSPIKLTFKDEDLLEGLERLIEEGFLIKNNGLYEIEAEFSSICSLLGSCSALSAISVRRRSHQKDSGTKWSLEHFAVQLAIDSMLWLYDFSDISSDDFQIEISSINGQQFYNRLAKSILLLDQSSETEMQESEDTLCPKCNYSLRPDIKFCPECGLNLKKE